MSAELQIDNGAVALLEYMAQTLDRPGRSDYEPVAELVLALPSRLELLEPVSLRWAVFDCFCSFARAYQQAAMPCLLAGKNIVYFTAMALYLRGDDEHRRLVDSGPLKRYVKQCQELCPGHEAFFTRHRRRRSVEPRFVEAQKRIQSLASMASHSPNK